MTGLNKFYFREAANFVEPSLTGCGLAAGCLQLYLLDPNSYAAYQYIRSEKLTSSSSSSLSPGVSAQVWVSQLIASCAPVYRSTHVLRTAL